MSSEVAASLASWKATLGRHGVHGVSCEEYNKAPATFVDKVFCALTGAVCLLNQLTDLCTDVVASKTHSCLSAIIRKSPANSSSVAGV